MPGDRVRAQRIPPTEAGPGIDGILVLAKPAGPTSHDMVALVRRLSGTKRVGHGGTLDPFASGVLPVFLGRATRLVEYHMADRKAYKATICLGASSTTDDVEGELSPGAVRAPDRSGFEGVLPALRGEIEQRPPAYSALKVGGRRAYALARAGETPDLPMRAVKIHRLELVEWDDSDPLRPLAIVEVECSAGTYIRALARDLGERLGCGAYLGTLVRTASGPFRLADAHAPDELRGAAAGGTERLRSLLLPMDAGLDGLPALVLGPSDLAAASRGQVFRPSRGRPRGVADEVPVRLLDGAGMLVGIGTWTGGRIAPDKILIDPTEPPPTSATEAVRAEAEPAERDPAARPEAGEGHKEAAAPPGEQPIAATASRDGQDSTTADG